MIGKKKQVSIEKTAIMLRHDFKQGVVLTGLLVDPVLDALVVNPSSKTRVIMVALRDKSVIVRFLKD